MANVFNIFWQALVLYFKNCISFIKYMAFPVFGQILGALWIFGISYVYIEHLPKIMINNTMNNFAVIFLILLLITLPGLFVMLKAFWEYIVAYGAVNSMLDGLVKSGWVYDFPAHNEVVIRKTPKFIGIWLIISLLGAICLFPIFWIFGAIIFVYFILVFQIFVFEPDENIFRCFKRSFEIIKGRFAPTFILMVLIGGFSMWLLPWIFEQLLEICKIFKILIIPIDGVVSLLPIDEINKQVPFEINSLMLSEIFLKEIIIFIFAGLTLPLRSICWGLWYRKNAKAKQTVDKRLLDRKVGKKKNEN